MWKKLNVLIRIRITVGGKDTIVGFSTVLACGLL